MKKVSELTEKTYGPGFYLRASTREEKTSLKENGQTGSAFLIVDILDEDHITGVNPSQYKILKELLDNKNKPVSKLSLSELVYDKKTASSREKELDPILSRLRKSLDMFRPGLSSLMQTGVYEAVTYYSFVTATKHKSVSEKLFPGNSRLLIPQRVPDDYVSRRYTDITILEDDMKHGIICLYGYSCTGKTYYLNTFSHLKKDKVLASFFCKWDVENRTDPLYVIKDLCVQLAEKDKDYHDLLEAVLATLSADELLSITLDACFDLLLAKPLSILSNRADSVGGYIIIDALDECKNAKALVNNIVNCSFATGGKVVFILSCRGGRTLSELKRQKALCVSFNSSKDIHHYITSLIPDIDPIDLGKLSKDCKGNYLFAKYKYSAFFGEKSPRDLDEAYYFLFEQVFHGTYTHVQRQLLSVIVTANSPLSTEDISKILRVDIGTVTAALSDIMDIIDAELMTDTDLISLFHKSVSDWLHSPASGVYRISEKEGATLLFDYIVRESKSGINYVPKTVAYSVLKNWAYYGKKSAHPEFLLMRKDEQFLIDVIRKHRRNSNFSKARDAIDALKEKSEVGSIFWIQLCLANIDLHFDLYELEAADKELLKLHDYISIMDPLTKADYYEDMAWSEIEHAAGGGVLIEEKAKRYTSAAKYLKDQLNIYEGAKECFSPERESHIFYILSILQYRFHQVTQSETGKLALFECSLASIDRAMKILRDEVDTDRVEYSTMLKHKGWILQKQGSVLCSQEDSVDRKRVAIENYQLAEEAFSKALEIETRIFTGISEDLPEGRHIPISQYLATTYRALAENELLLGVFKSQEYFLRQSLEHIDLSILIYGALKDQRFMLQKEYCESVKQNILNAIKLV